MKTIIEKGKWKEIKTTVYNIEKITEEPFVESSDELKEITKKQFKQGEKAYNNRMKCNCCKNSWENNEPVFLCYTNKLNKLICGKCKNILLTGREELQG